MNTKRVVRLFGGVAVLAVASATLMAMSATAHGLDTPALEGAQPARAEARILVAQADPVATYSDDQADKGKKRFNSECAECHGEDLNGGLLGGPPLKGNAFEEHFFGGAPASGLFQYMSTLMPPNDPGRFSPSQYAEIMAFILKGNGMQSGAPLPSDDKLDNVVLTK